MLYDLTSFQILCRRQLCVDDLTMVVAVRAYSGNLWVKERLRKLAGYYEPAPKVIIVDFGSPEGHRDEVRGICEEGGLEYLFEPDEGVFSLARARNLGARAATTDLLFFSDVDCFGERDLCERLVKHANAVELGAYFDQMINLPVYHLAEDTSHQFFQEEEPQSASDHLGRTMAQSVYGEPGEQAEYVDSASNFFVCRRQFFELIGGYNENFRGHGSEDYEFHLRFATLAGQLPLPDKPLKNLYRPLRGEAFGHKRYRGFRRLGELMAFQAEVAGLRIAHLYHSRARSEGSWYLANDWARTRFCEQAGPFLEAPWRLVAYDWLPRQKKALVLLKHDWQVEFFLPLRLAGYHLDAVRDNATERERAARLIQDGAVDAVAMFNPYMKSHAGLRPLFEQARAARLETVVVERGALPESWYYGTDVSYNDPDWSWTSVVEANVTAEELQVAGDYLVQLRTGRFALEDQGDPEATRERHSSVVAKYRTVCLVPLQLDDDMAVTQYTDGYLSYREFRDQVESVAAGTPDVLFLVKAHPLSKDVPNAAPDNVLWCSREDNIHSLIELATCVICYNSGVGLLALLHEKALVTVGNAFYNLEGLGQRARDFQHAAALARQGDKLAGQPDVRRYLAWLLLRKYSFFKATSRMRDFGNRRSHEYRNLKFYQLSVGSHHLSALRAGEGRAFSASSYASSRLGVGAGDLRVALKHGTAMRLLRKLTTDPKKFCVESNYRVLRWLGRKL